MYIKKILLSHLSKHLIFFFSYYEISSFHLYRQSVNSGVDKDWVLAFQLIRVLGKGVIYTISPSKLINTIDEGYFCQNLKIARNTKLIRALTLFVYEHI